MSNTTDGAHAGSTKTLAVRSPYSGEIVGELPMLELGGAFDALARARELHDRRGLLPRQLRVDVLAKAAERVRAERDALALLIASEGGKPLVDARVEVDRAAAGLTFLSGEALRLAGAEIPMGGTAATTNRLAFTTTEPIGVVLGISAFNHPLNLIVHQVGPAIAAGCPVLIKPALETPLSCARLLEILLECGLPEGAATLVIAGNDVAEALVRDPRVAFLTFIGSAKIGWQLRGAVAPGTRVALEHGGAAPVIVDETADLDAAAALVTKGGFYHAGQVCVSVQRVFAHERIADAFTEKLREKAAALVVGDPTLAETGVGPLIRAREVDRVAEWVGEAVRGGARALAGGERLDHQSYAPTILVDAPERSRVLTDEVFGPVVVVVRFAELDRAVAAANDVRWSFQSAVFTRDLDRALFAARRLDASSVMVNDHTAFRADWMPFAGRRESGLGVGGLPWSVRDMTAEKLLVFSSAALAGT
jgi:acyl-CoA reductase-like NAD-dependent aldehyde dehydrogenase